MPLNYFILLDHSVILLGFRHLASSTPSISSAGVAIGAGLIPSISIFATCRNPIISNVLIRWALIGSPSAEVPGSIGSVYSLLILYAFYSMLIIIYLFLIYSSLIYLSFIPFPSINTTLIIMQCIIYYSEQYFTKAIDMIFIVLQLITVWKKVPLNSLLYYLLLTAGYAITIVSIKIFITVSMMIGNIIDIYLIGLMMILISSVMYSGYFGLIILSYLLYLFLTKMEVFLIISFMLEPFSLLSQTITLSNRLSINILAGSLSIQLLSVAVIICSIEYLVINYWISLFYLIIYSFEILNSHVQLFIFTLLSIEYMVDFDRVFIAFDHIAFLVIYCIIYSILRF